MKKFLLVAVFVSVFFIGYITPKFIYASPKENIFAALRNIPQRGVYGDLLSTENLKLIPTYEKVLNSILNDYINPGNTDERKITYSGIHGMLLAFNDPFSNFFEPDEYKKMREENEGNFSGIGAVLQMTEISQVLIKEVMKNAPAEKSGIKTGDVIVAVDGKPTVGKTLEEVVSEIRGEVGTKVKITVERKNESQHLTFEVTRDIVETVNSSYRMLDKEKGIGYIKLDQFNQNADTEVDNALSELEKEGLKGLVFDLRGNPGGLLDMAVSISSRFVKDGTVVIIQSRGGKREHLMTDDEKHNHKAYPLVILVNGSSASASEIVSGCVKDHKAGTIVGDVTFGKGLVQSQVPLRDGSAISITTAKYLTPNETDIHKKGIEPDYFAEQNEDYDIDKPETDFQLTAGKKILMNKMGLLGDEEIKDLKENSEKLKIKYEEKLKEKENKKNK